MPGRYLIIDLQAEPPGVVNTDDVLPTAVAVRLDAIDAKLELIMTSQAEGQAQIQNLADGMNVIAAHVSSASTTLADWIAQHQDAPLDFTPALNALASMQAADTTLGGIVPQAPPAPLPDPVPLPPDPAPDPTTPVTDPTTPDPTLPPGGDLGTATDPTTTPDGGTLDPSQQAPPDAGPTVNPLS